MNGGPAEQFIAPDGKYDKLIKPPYAFNLPTFENKEDKRVVMSNKSASLVDLGDGVACLTFHSKMNSIDDSIIAMAQQSIAKVGEDFEALVIGNEGAGLRRLVRQAASATVAVPIEPSADSLNAGVAAAILCYELTRTGS